MCRVPLQRSRSRDAEGDQACFSVAQLSVTSSWPLLLTSQLESDLSVSRVFLAIVAC